MAVEKDRLFGPDRHCLQGIAVHLKACYFTVAEGHVEPELFLDVVYPAV